MSLEKSDQIFKEAKRQAKLKEVGQKVLRRSPHVKGVKVFYQESSSEEERKEKKMKVKSPKVLCCLKYLQIWFHALSSFSPFPWASASTRFVSSMQIFIISALKRPMWSPHGLTSHVAKASPLSPDRELSMPDMDSGQYMSRISAQIEEAYHFLCEMLERVSAQVLLQCHLEYCRAM